MKTIIVTACRDDWQHAQAAGEYTQSTIDSTLTDVGFIHCTFPNQTIAMVNRHFTDRNDVVLLLTDAEKVKYPIKYEGAVSGRAGTFPHIYGPLNTDAVYKTVELKKDKEGNFIPPKELEGIK